MRVRADAPAVEVSRMSHPMVSGGSAGHARRLPARTVVAIEMIQRALEDRATARTRRWWERSTHGGEAVFRGVRMADVRRVVHAWERTDGAEFSASAKKELALALLREDPTEDKLAGILFLSEILLPRGDLGLRDLARFAGLFRDGSLADRNACDRFCVKVLGPLAEQSGPRCARAIADWRSSGNPWQRRAAGVAFVNAAKRGDDNFTGFTTLLLRVCDATVRHPEPFARTGTGRVLRELSRAEPERVAQFVERRLDHFSGEALRQATSQLDAATARELRSDGRRRRRRALSD